MKPKVAEVKGLPYQYRLFGEEVSPAAESRVTPVCFREIVREIPDTNYLTHGLFYYPAKFIPHVPHYCVRRFCSEGGWVIDPFAGSGTVGLEAVLAERNALLIDLNPLLAIYAETKINFRYTDLQAGELLGWLNQLFASQIAFYPQWSNLSYWYPEQVLEVLARYWGWIHAHDPANPYVQVLRAALMRANRRFSLTDHKAPKLFRSKRKLQEVSEWLQRPDWKEEMDQFIIQAALEIMGRLQSLAQVLKTTPCRAIAFAGVDSATVDLTECPRTEAVITSPPYLQAQEYLRTFKLDLFWTGVPEAKVRELMRLEIPYRKAHQPFSTPTYEQVCAQLQREDLKRLMHAYFYYTTRALQNAATTLKSGGHLCVFVGSPTVDGIQVETWRILAEFFAPQGFAFCGVLEDVIQTRQLFRQRKNKNPRGMESEFLLIMRKE
ncbi:MAG: site-specific DNA-methyltransferase [Fimbriimonadales bacterium]|jgi:hypothetical protein|nr:site-specific DNA-methyltransferase [Armatimonadota bacterium]MCX7687145.1 site-specific DNA-methyltransferase [Fimbriimonadales bacterium]GBC90537.1 hypothetical protein HRbin14_01274 [bacterium HR14]GIV12074.1 MAG: hypothetical protein KatS3mg021_0356 [Fimbriimonadales bacterium]CUU34783.1 DNA methylase [Armatimonadetes bacterium DC]